MKFVRKGRRFLPDESFQKWVKGHKNPSNWNEWSVENPFRAKLVEEARLWIIGMKVEQKLFSTTNSKYK